MYQILRFAQNDMGNVCLIRIEPLFMAKTYRSWFSSSSLTLLRSLSPIGRGAGDEGGSRPSVM